MLTFTNVYTQGAVDPNGVNMECTEFRSLLVRPDLQLLFGGTGRWEDTASPDVGQILRYSGSGKWVVEYTGLMTPHQQVIACLNQVQFPQAKVNLCVASTWGWNQAFVLTRNDATSTWASVSILKDVGTGVQIRAFGSHTDTVDGVDYVFAGIDPDGIVAGTWHAANKAIAWNPTIQQPGVGGYRVMAFAELNGKLYAAMRESVYVYQDGKRTWAVAGTNPNPAQTNPAIGALRGMIASPLNDGTLWLADCGTSPAIVSFNPMTKRWITLYAYRAGGGILAYNGINYINGTVYVGAQRGGATYLTWDTKGDWQTNTVKQLGNSPLVAVRAIAQGPVNPDIIYMAGYDCDGKPSHRTGWCYSAT